MSFPDYDEFTHKVDSVDTIYAADINELQDAIQEIATRTYGGPSAYDALIAVDGDYTAYDAAGNVIATNASLPTVWAAVDAEDIHIHFAAGAYTTSSTLTLLSGMTVTGAGATKTIITKTGTGSLFEGEGADSSDPIINIEIAHLGMSGPSVSGTQVVGSGVFFDFYENVEVHHCEISGFGSSGDNAGIEADRGFDAHFWANRLHDNKNGICTGAPGSTTVRSERVLIDGNRCFDNYDDGIHTQRSRYVEISNNHTWGHPNGGAADGSGIDTLGDEFDTITGNVSFDNTRGIEVGNSANASYPDTGHTISNNVLYGNTYGLALVARQERIIATGNVMEGNTDGVRLGTGSAGQSLNDITVSDNQISNNSAHGIDLFGYVDRATIAFNILRSNSTADIRVRTSGGNNPATYALIDNRTMSGTGISDSISAVDMIVRLFGA